MLTKYNWLQLNCTHFTFDSPIKKVKAVFTSICNEMKKDSKKDIYRLSKKKSQEQKNIFAQESSTERCFFSHMNANR